jgi:dTDP-4-amino-4,6-dideoxygalactose transaminase
MEPKYYHAEVGGNFRLAAIQAAVLQVKLPHLNEWHAQRRENAEYYDKHIQTPGVVTPPVMYGRENHIYNQYIIRVPERRDELRAFLNEREIGHDVYYPVPFHLQECFRELGHQKGDFPESERAAEQTIALPVYPEITHVMQDNVIQALDDFYKG